MRSRYGQSALRFDPFLPLSVEKELRVCRYTTFCELNDLDVCRFLPTVSPDGFTLREGRRYIILYNDAPHIPDARKRFTLAHELGHYILRHRTDGEKQEREANCFARNLLAPYWIADQNGIRFKDYPQVFGISATAARMCERMRTIDILYSPRV
jgi:Zn-dependent peptidase ImmA (M78 family)